MSEGAQTSHFSPGVRWTFARLVSLLRAYPLGIGASIALGLFAALASFAWQFGIYLLVVEALDPSPDRSKLVWTLGGIFVLGVLGRVAFLCSTALSHGVAIDVQRDLRFRLADHLARVPIAIADRYGSKALRRFVLDDVESIEDGIAHLVPEGTANFVMPPIVLVAIFAIDWRMAVATAIPLLLGFAAMLVMTRGSADITRAYYAGSAALSAQAAEFVKGLPTIRLFDDGDKALTRFRETTASYLDVIGEWARRIMRANALLQVFLTSSLVFVLPLGLYLISAGTLSVSRLIFFVVFAPGLGGLVTRVSNFAFRFAQQGEVLWRLDAFLSEPHLPLTETPLVPVERTVRFEDVCLLAGGHRILDAINLTLIPGTVTALVGATGAGKSSLAGLLMRFDDPTAGRITIGDIDLRAMTPEVLYGLVAIVPQDAWLFAGTIADNLRLAAPEADNATLERALERAQARDFVAALPGDLEAALAGAGGNFSGGERQRLAIARAMLRGAPILVFDEATSAADPLNEREIQRGLTALARGRTVLVIAHRLASIVDADQIAVMDGGRIVERGTHAELLARRGRYAHLWACYNDTSTPAPAVAGGFGVPA